jgi:small GTP-binding protein
MQYIQILWKQYSLINVKAEVNLKVHSSSDLNRLSKDDVAERTLMNFFQKGCGFWLSVKTNANKLFKELVQEDTILSHLKPMLIAFLQYDSYLHLKAKAVDVGSFFSKDSAPTPEDLDIFNPSSPFLPIFAEIRDFADAKKETPIYVSFVDLFENYLKAKVNVSVHIPNITMSLQFKTSGVRELYQKIVLNDSKVSTNVSTVKNLSMSDFSLFPKRKVRAHLLGLDAAGKTTILYQLKLGEVVSTIPTVGFNVETIEYKNISLNIWDVGGSESIRTQWKKHLENVEVIIYVVESHENDRLIESRDTLKELLKEEALRDSLLLVYANKMELPYADIIEVTKQLELNSITGRDWHIQGSNATTGDGLYEGLDWVVKKLNTKKE